MNPFAKGIETRTNVISRHVTAYLRETGLKMPTFAQAVVEQYSARTPDVLRTIEFSSNRDSFQKMKNDAQTLDRYMDGTCRMPADLEEAIVFALPAERMEALRAELAGRYGLLAVPKMAGDSLTDRAQFAARLAKESGAALQALSKLLTDDQPGPQHEADLEVAGAELERLEGIVTSIRTCVEEHHAAAAAVTAATQKLRQVGG
jgi:hypothetical protein